MILSSFLDLLDHPRRSGRGWVARCPAHADRSPSLSISDGNDGRILVRCWSGCTADEITAAVGLSLRDLFPDGKPDRDAIREAKRRREKQRRDRKVTLAEADVFRTADLVVLAATNIDVSRWSEADFDQALGALGDAYSALVLEQSEARLSEIEQTWTERDMTDALKRSEVRGGS